MIMDTSPPTLECAFGGECLYSPTNNASILQCLHCGLSPAGSLSMSALATLLLRSYTAALKAPVGTHEEKVIRDIHDALLKAISGTHLQRTVTEHIDGLFSQHRKIQGQAYRDLVASFKEHDIVVFKEKFSAYYLRSLGLKADTIIDVGANNGTEPLFEAFPKSKFVLIDPLQDELDSCKDNYPSLDADFHCIAVGAAQGHLRITKTSVTGHSSAMDRHVNEGGESISVKMDRLDNLLLKHDYKAPYGVKIDTEGYELEVLHGLTGALDKVEFVIAEVSIKKIFKHGYKFSDMVAFMATHDFQLFDVLNAAGHQPNHFDCLFLHENNPLFGMTPR